MKKMSLIKNSNGEIICVAANKETEEEKKVPINIAEFTIECICQDGYECDGEVTKEYGTIINIIDTFFETELSETQKENYIPFVEFIKNANKYHKEKNYTGDCSIELLAEIFICGLQTLSQEFECRRKPKSVTKEEVVNYLSSLYIDMKFATNPLPLGNG